jgi:hypothetical protein
MVLIEATAAMALLYALLSIVASAMKEAVEAWAQQRKSGFRSAMEDLLQHEGAIKFLKHARIRALTSATGEPDPGNKNHWPSYIDPKVFGVVAADLAKELPQSRIGEILAWAQTANQNAVQVLEQVYADRMERLSGSFKREAQKALLVIGFVVAALVDADTIQMARRLTTDAPMRTALAQLSISTTSAQDVERLCGIAAGASPRDRTSQLMSCVQEQAPDLLGWSSTKWAALFAAPWMFIVKAFGYALTAIAISLGAAFWFDLISKVANIRATTKPRKGDR